MSHHLLTHVGTGLQKTFGRQVLGGSFASMSSSGSGVSDSQSSQFSNFSLGWSQETTAQVLKAVGMNASDGDR